VERIQGHDVGELLRVALNSVPEPIAHRLGFVHFFIGDPVFAALHRVKLAPDGGSYRTIPQYVSESWQRTDPARYAARRSCCPMGQVQRKRSSMSWGMPLMIYSGTSGGLKQSATTPKLMIVKLSPKRSPHGWDCRPTKHSGIGFIDLTAGLPRCSMPLRCSCRIKS
jgi:hypothetical protein